MGCSIHIITEIKRNGKWEYVPDVPKSLDKRDYSLFAFIAKGVRDSFGSEGFEKRGLPADISARKFRFKSNSPWHYKTYKEGKGTFLLTTDGKYQREFDVYEQTKREISEEEYNTFCLLSSDERYVSPSMRYDGTTQQRNYYIQDATMLNGKWVLTPYKNVYETFEEFEKIVFEDDEWDETMQDYGSWDIDFDKEDLHNASWLSLKDFLEKDCSDYASHKYKLDREFYEKFKEFGGILPSIFSVKEESCVGGLIDAFREAFEPTVLVKWPMTEEEKSELPLFKGIEELKEIQKKYNIENPEDIRIVFAFDD